MDDGSKDKSGKLADEYASEHGEYVKIIHKKNGGISSARNASISIARGEYVVFPDPDDYLSDNYTEIVLATITEYKRPDMIIVDYNCLFDDRMTYKTIKKFKEGFVAKDKLLQELVLDDDLKSMVWCKFIKKSFFEHRRFDVNVNVMEDALILTDICIELQSIVYIPRGVYYYVIRKGFLTTAMSVDDLVKTFRIKKDRYEKYRALLNDVSISSAAVSAYELCAVNWKGDADIDIKESEQFIKDNIYDILKDKHCSINDKKHALFVWTGIADLYNRWKYK